MKYGIIVNTNECVGCHACFTACKEENQVLPGVKWNRIDRIEHEKARVIEYFRLSCMHCEDPACMKVCPAKAIHKGPAGEVLVDHAKCIGCRMCEKACPYGAPQFADPKKTSYFGEKTPLEVIPVRPETARTAPQRGCLRPASPPARRVRSPSSTTTTRRPKRRPCSPGHVR